MEATATKDEYEWVSIKEAWRIATKRAIDVSLNQFRIWCKEGKHGIVQGKFGGRVVVRKDTIPGVVVCENGV